MRLGALVFLVAAIGFCSLSSSGASGGGEGRAGSTGSGGARAIGFADVDALRRACVQVINEYREKIDAPPLARAEARVEKCSDLGAKEDAKKARPHGSATRCPGMKTQNTCPDWPMDAPGGAEEALKACLARMWAEGEPPEGRKTCVRKYFKGDTRCFLKHGHYLNMSDPDRTVVACGFHLMDNGHLWMNQDFGGSRKASQ